MKLDFFPYGTQYHRAPTPLADEWDGDLAEIARAGYTHVQFRPQWRCHERIKGEWVWDDLDALFDLAAKHGLKVILKPMLECAPDWVFEELGGSRVGFGGVPIEPVAIGSFYAGGWMPCFDNPEVVSAATDFVRALTIRYGEHPALWFYDAWNEPRSRPLGQCRCRHSVASYREWLRQMFGTIENLNSLYGKYWTSFNTIQPAASGWDFAEMFLWRTWATHAVTEHVRFVSEAIKDVDPSAFVLVHVGGCSVIQDAASDANDDILMASGSSTDRYGTSFPVSLHPSSPIQHANPDLISDWIRRVDPEYWCHEFYTNHGNWCQPPDPQVLNRLIWMAISGGTAGFTFWQYRSERVGNETNGYGMREIDGSPTDRSRVADGIAGILREHGGSLSGTRRPASRIALLYSRESDLLSRVTEMQEIFIHNEADNYSYPYKRAIQAAHALYLNRGETVDWVIPGDDLSAIPLLHITAAEMVDSALADQLREYVSKGGKLIVEYPFACRDENTWVSVTRPNNGLADLLGCSEASRVMMAGSEVRFTDGIEVSASGWKVDLIPEGGQVIAEWSDGNPAVIKHNYGKGIVYTLGVSLALSYTNAAIDSCTQALDLILDDLGLESNPSTCDGVWIRRRIAEGREIWFVFNITQTSQSVEIPREPAAIWQEADCTLDGSNLYMAPGSTWVAEFVTQGVEL